jgi:peptidyl-prolyl cis-trans isomerase D
MLDLFRKKGAMSVVYTLLMGGITLVFVLEFRPNTSGGGPLQGLSRKCVAKVRGTCIDEREWKAQRFLLRGESEATNKNWNKAALDSLIERTLLEQEADRLGIRVSEDEVMNELVRWRVHVTLPASMRPEASNLRVFDGVRWTQFGTKDKPFDQQIFDKVVQNTTGQNPTEFIDQQQREVLAARVVDLVSSRVRVSDVEAFEQFRADRSNTTLQFVRFDPKFFGDRFVAPEPAAIDGWAAANKEAVDAREASLPKDQDRRVVDVARILVESKKDDPAEKRAEAKKKADDLLAKLKTGSDPSALVKDAGAGISSSPMSWSVAADLGAPLRDGLAKLKVGDAAVIEVEDGFHVVRLEGRLDGRTAVAWPLYRDAKGAELAQQAVEKFAAAAKPKVPVAIDAALQPKVEELKKAGKSEADAKAQVVADETKIRFEAALDGVLDALAPKAKSGWRSDDRRPQVDDSSPFAAGGSPFPGADDQTAVTSAVDALTTEAPFAGPLKVGDAHVVVVLRERHVATKEEFDKEKSAYLGRLLQKKREDAVINYVTSLREAASKQITIEKRYTDVDQKGGGSAAPPMPGDE